MHCAHCEALTECAGDHLENADNQLADNSRESDRQTESQAEGQMEVLRRYSGIVLRRGVGG